MIAMILGETTLLDDEIKELYQHNGISHILAISGLHISLIGLSLYKFLSKIRIPIIPTTILSIGFIFTYGILTNFSVSTNRAVVMLVVMMIAKVIGRTYDNLSAISLSALIILIQSPLQILNAGFLLSFGAMLGIVLIYPIFHEILPTQSNLLNGLMLSFCIQCMTLPIILYFFL
jgi:competence protein ComEC